MTGHTVQRRRVVPVHEFIPHFFMRWSRAGTLNAPPIPLRTNRQSAGLRQCASSAPYLRACNHPCPAGGNITGLHDHLVQRIRALTVNGGLYGALLDFSDTIGGFQRQGLHQLDLPVDDILCHLPDRCVADHIAKPLRNLLRYRFPLVPLLTLYLQEHFLAYHCRPVVQHLGVVDEVIGYRVSACLGTIVGASYDLIYLTDYPQ
ncbi:Uncharacterised protein [Serratia marcescens]|nr:Uncharacterised protein [Serratia marcescens]